jgi:hypothetical protein
MSDNSGQQEISLASGFGAVVHYGGTTIKLHPGGDIDAYTNGAVHVHPAAIVGEGVITEIIGDREIGAIESTGEHEGEIYGGIYPADNKPIWFSEAPRLMDHYAAAAWAKKHGGALPSRKQGDYLTTLKGQGGAFTEIFNRGGPFPAGYVWLAEPDSDFRDYAWCQRLSDGDQNAFNWYYEMPVLSVRR